MSYDPRGEDTEFQSVLAQLYSRKASRKAFNMIKRDFDKAEPGVDLCKVIGKAQKDIMRTVASDFKSGRDIGTSTRTQLFKVIDYSSWLRFCEGKKEE